MIVELRTYTIQAGKVQTWLDHYEKNGLPTQQRMLGQLVGFFRSEIGMQNQLTHLWAYESLADREARRAAMQQEPEWKAYVRDIPPVVQSAENRILVPTSFSPLR